MAFGERNAGLGFEHFELLRYSGCCAVGSPCHRCDAAAVSEFTQQFKSPYIHTSILKQNYTDTSESIDCAKHEHRME